MKWTNEKIEKYKQASEYTSFHKKLSVLAEPYIDRVWSMADVGCGPGLLATYLAPMVARLDAIDNDDVAIADLIARLDDVSITDRITADKVKPRLASLEDIKGERWDAIVMSFFGIDEAVLENVLPLADKRALIYMHGRREAEGLLASEDDGKKFSADELGNYLEQKGLAFKKSVMEMQFGQPFRDIGDIHKFLMKCRVDLETGGTSDVQHDNIEKLLTDAEERIIQTKRFDYPYYLPKSVSVALFIIRT